MGDLQPGILRKLSVRWCAGALAIVLAYLLSVPGSQIAAVENRQDNLRFVPITRGDIAHQVTSAGTLEAVDTVEVSSQLSGQIAALMADHNSIVRAGDPLAALDTATYQVLVQQAEAALAVAQAQHREAAAAVEGAQARYDEALRDFEVKTTLAKSGGGAQRDAERSQAVARVQVSELSAAAAREAPNPEGLLFPGMTADTRIVVEEHQDVLIVPNAALNFRPRKDQASKPEAGKGMLWVRSQSSDLHAVPVTLGATGDSLTQLVSSDINVGEQVAVGYRSKP